MEKLVQLGFEIGAFDLDNAKVPLESNTHLESLTQTIFQCQKI